MNLPQFIILSSAAVAPLSVQAGRFSAIQLEPDGSKLQVLRTDGHALSAPKFDNQDGFEKPAISADWRHVGWLALYPDQ